MSNYPSQGCGSRHGFVAMKAKYRLEQFGQVLNLRNRDNAPYLLIGGQAVNYWASRYLEKEQLLGEP